MSRFDVPPLPPGSRVMREIVIDSFAGGGGKPVRHRPQLYHGLSYLPEYRAWQTMRLRCTEPTNPAWDDYGGRGITICDRWLNDPAAFYADMGRKPSPQHEIDRIDNAKGYEPSNCRWATRKENSRNRRSNRLLEFRGESRPLAEWCERLGLPRDTVRKRLLAGWSVEKTLTTPVRPKLPNGCGAKS